MHITVFARVWIPMITWKLRLLYLLLPTFQHNLSKNYLFFFTFSYYREWKPPLTLTFTNLALFCCAVLYSKTIMWNNVVRKSEYKFSIFFLKWKYEIEDWNSSFNRELFYSNYISKMKCSLSVFESFHFLIWSWLCVGVLKRLWQALCLCNF